MCYADDGLLMSDSFKMLCTDLILTKSNVRQVYSAVAFSFNSKEFWHKFILENGGLFDKDLILQAVLNSIHPVDLVPVKYTVCGKDSYFLARNCGPALEKFCSNLLQPIRIRGRQEKINLSIHICYIPIEEYKVNMQLYLKNAIEKRYNQSREGYIDLSAFHKEPELYEVLFCPLSTPRFLLYVLTILKRTLNVKEINLSNNEIENLTPLEVLGGFEGLKCLDLRNNKIKEKEFIDLIGNIVPTLEEINLDGNPICSDFDCDLEYVQWIRNAFPLISKIDGVSIHYNLPHYQTWFCSKASWRIINEFVRHYFTLYDRNRKALENTYDRNAIFTLTCTYPADEKFSSTQLECYLNLSQDLLNTNSVRNCHVNNTYITSLLCKLPPTKHDPYSFKIDLLHCQGSEITLFVCGLFKDFGKQPRIRSFSRTFVLKKVAPDEYKVTNDLFHVTNATENEIYNSYWMSKKYKKKTSKLYLTETEENSIVEIFCRLTDMNKFYSKKCLQDCHWDIKKALEVFLETHGRFYIPSEAFIG